MENWEIRYFSYDKGKGPVEEWLDSLKDDQFKAVAEEIKLLEKAGNKLKLPHSRPLKKGLFELRERRYGLRIYYCFHGRRVVLLLAAGDKSSQDRDMKIADGRLKKAKKEKI